ncbi:MAG: Rab family GTPase [Promethearchaeota archaeon]
MVPHSEIGGLVMESQLNELLANLLEVLPDLLAALIVDLDGLNIANQSRKEVDETIIGAVMGAIDQTIKRIKTSTEVSLGSGVFDTDEFQVSFVKIGGKTPALFVMVADHYSNIDIFLPYSYLIAEKISLILSNRYTSLNIPLIHKIEKLEKNRQIEVKNENITVINLMVLGDPKVGKSCLMELYVNGEIVPDYKPTIGISILVKTLQITKSINLIYQIFDMSGTKSLLKVRKTYYLQLFSPLNKRRANTAAVLIIFDFTNTQTLDNSKYWIEESQKFIKDSTIPYILIGNKIDLVENRENIREKAKLIAKKYNCLYVETSAITGEGLDEIFTLLATKYS